MYINKLNTHLGYDLQSARTWRSTFVPDPDDTLWPQSQMPWRRIPWRRIPPWCHILTTHSFRDPAFPMGLGVKKCPQKRSLGEVQWEDTKAALEWVVFVWDELSEMSCVSCEMRVVWDELCALCERTWAKLSERRNDGGGGGEGGERKPKNKINSSAIPKSFKFLHFFPRRSLKYVCIFRNLTSTSAPEPSGTSPRICTKTLLNFI